jgi:putative polyhydroxyalkanoate system protein
VADILIEREHGLSLEQARKIARTWADEAQETFSLECTYAQGEGSDTITFTRPGLDGVLHVQAGQFRFEAELGFLLSAFKGRIEAEIAKNLDILLAAA